MPDEAGWLSEEEIRMMGYWACLASSDYAPKPSRINTLVPYVILRRFNKGEVVIQRVDGQPFDGEHRWIVKEKDLVPWSELVWVQLANKLCIHESEAYALHTKIQEYNRAAGEATMKMEHVLQSIRQYMNDHNKTEFISRLVLAGTDLDKIIRERTKMLIEEAEERERNQSLS